MKVVEPETRPLPMKWDGVPVEWSAWVAFDMFICPPPKPEPCQKCGLIAPQSISHGIREGRLTGETLNRKAFVREIVPVLYAYRCTACGHTEVSEGDKRWVLDDSDYGVFGSVAR